MSFSEFDKAVDESLSRPKTRDSSRESGGQEPHYRMETSHVTPNVEQRSRQLLATVEQDDEPIVRPYAGRYLPIKRVLDFGAAVVLLVLLSPFMVLAALAVALTSRGPIFYRQERLGQNHVPFKVWKFRTMIDNAEAVTGPVWSLEGDPRITPVGALLRKTHIDEFPQLFNVLRGEMSLVGPRPERPMITDELTEKIPAYRLRLSTRPGITGFAQVRLPADVEIDGTRRKLAYDLYYIQHMGLILDLKIILRTALNFCWSLGEVGVTSVRLPREEAVERLVPYLLDESSARQTFDGPFPALAGRAKTNGNGHVAEPEVIIGGNGAPRH